MKKGLNIVVITIFKRFLKFGAILGIFFTRSKKTPLIFLSLV
jgi:hypothetical protein